MFRAFLDTRALAVPVIHTSQSLANRKARFEAYVSRLVQMDKAYRTHSAKLFLPRDAEKTLFETSLYPLWESLEAGLRHSELTETYEARDIVTVVNGFLKQAPRIEDTLGIEEILIDDAQIDPDAYMAEIQPSLAVAHKQLLVLVALLFGTGARNKCGEYVVTDVAGGGILTVNVTGHIVDWELSEKSGCAEVAVPFLIEAPVSLSDGWQCISLNLNATDIWCEATCQSEYEFAFSVYLMQFCQKNGFEQEWQNWNIGPQLIDGAGEHGFLHENARVERLLVTMAETVLGKNLSQTHQLREDRGGNSNQKMRGKDGAWRRDIDYEFHLHYWSTEDGVEFACVVVHNDFSIPT